MANVNSWLRATISAAIVCGTCAGCLPGGAAHRQLLAHRCPVEVAPDQPRELSKMVMPDYVIEPPDILLIDAVRTVPLPPYRIEPLDTLAIQVTEPLPQQP